MKRRIMLIHAFFWGMCHPFSSEEQHYTQAKLLYDKYIATRTPQADNRKEETE